jgi:HSP20 family protein
MGRTRPGLVSAGSEQKEANDMSATTVPVQQSSPDLSDWPGSPLSTLHHEQAPTQPIPTEEYLSDGRYTVRFELPGLDPEQDLDVSVESQVLNVQAERHASEAGKYHSHFRYGLFCSHVTLPAGIDDRDVTATYRNGILEVSVGFESEHAARRITVVPVQSMP